MESLDTPGKRLRWARERDKRYDTPTDAAKGFGWTVSTYLSHENGDRNPSREAAKKYGAAYKVPWEWILEGGPMPGRRRTGMIPTVGEVAAGQWLDVEIDVDRRDLEQFPITADPTYPFDAQYGLIVRGTSMNRFADNGEVLHCVDIIKASVEPAEDDVVIVERRRAQASQREVTAKRIRKRGRMIVLAPDSTEAKWKPIEFDPSHQSDDESVEVIAVVIGIYKPIRRRK
jgi:SOS-response transcriptional repressor LexA